jgi:DHA1 family bicyclomycin/chloramphenicol resistance-like MFS transporter
MRNAASPGLPITPRSEVTLVLVLGALAAFGPLAIDTYLPAFPAIARDLHATAQAVDWTLAVYFLGLAVGQIIIGPITDRVGRRRPLRGGLLLFLASSLLAMVAPTLGWLVAARALQALGGAACSVTSRAAVRDLYRGSEAARVNSRIVLVMGAAPIVAPLVGAALLRIAGWRVIFAFLALVAALAYVLVRHLLPETAPRATAVPLAAGLRALVADSSFVGFALIAAMGSAGLFAYISGAPVIFIAIHHVPPASFSWLFGANAAAYIGMSQCNARLLRARSPAQLLSVGVGGMVTVGCGLTAAVAAGLGPVVLEAGFFLFLASLGLVLPNAIALALERQWQQAGNAAAWAGALQFGMAALSSAAVAALATTPAAATAMTMLTVATIAGGLRAWLWRHEHPRTCSSLGVTVAPE